MNRPSSSGSSIDGLYEREFVEIFQPAFAKRLFVDSSRLPFGKPSISNDFLSDTRPKDTRGFEPSRKFAVIPPLAARRIDIATCERSKGLLISNYCPCALNPNPSSL